MKDNDAVSPVLQLSKPWNQNGNPIWLASSISLQRNIEKFKFPTTLDVERKKQIIQLVGKEQLSLEQLVKPTLLKAEELSAFEKEYLMEHFLTMDTFQHTGNGEAFLIDETCETMTIFNNRDHLFFYQIDIKGDLENAWNKLIKIETALGKQFSYAFSPKFGFLTSDPSKCGTALQITIYLQLPALIHSEKIDTILEQNDDEGILITGIQGDPTEIIGDFILIQNNYALGVTEENILSSMRTYASKLIVEENNARSTIRQTQNPEIKDKVSRAYAILLHSYQIEAVEALNAISILKLGLDMEWLSGMTSNQLNELFFNCRRAHLLSQYNEKISQAEIPHKRAEFIHKALKNLHLNI